MKKIGSRSDGGDGNGTTWARINGNGTKNMPFHKFLIIIPYSAEQLIIK